MACSSEGRSVLSTAWVMCPFTSVFVCVCRPGGEVGRHMPDHDGSTRCRAYGSRGASHFNPLYHHISSRQLVNKLAWTVTVPSALGQPFLSYPPFLVTL